jgi:TatD family-associated radical SAM protein
MHSLTHALTQQFSKLLLPNGDEVTREEDEPTSDTLLHAVDQAFENGQIAVSDMDSAPITFAGYGEPLLRPDLLCNTAQLIKERRHGVPLRVKTLGLVSMDKATDVASELKDSGIDLISIGLHANNPPQYKSIVHPLGKEGFSEVCSFIIACVEAGLEVECQAVETPGVNVSDVRKLALSLGAHHFTTQSFHQ